MIVGILDCKNKTIYGINKKTNTPLVIFTSHSGEKFLIPTKLKYKNENLYAVVKFDKQDPKYRFPIGILKYTIGKVGDYKSHCEYLLHIHDLNIKEPQISKNKMKKLKKSDGDIWKIIDQKNLRTYKDKTQVYTVTVDPKESKDFDDAISISGDYLGIHIADVTFWLFHLGFDIDFFSTVYLPHRKINMIPSILADNICSLIEGKDRLALTLWFNLKDGSYTIEDNIINVDKNYSYEEFPKTNGLYKLSKYFGKMYNMDLENWDTHKMIEAFMILANNKVAEYLKDHNKGLFRTHNQKYHQYDLTKIQNSQFKRFMEIYLSNAAEYTEKQGKHYGLNLDLYTHFTSPIRRMADVYVHLLIKGMVVDVNFEKLNFDVSRTRKLKRDLEKYDVIKKLQKPIDTNGYVINFNKDVVTCYFPEINLCDNFNIIPKRLNDVMTEEDKNKIRGKLKIMGNISVGIVKKGNNLIYKIN